MTGLMNFFGIQPSDKKQRDKLANMMKVDKDLLAKFEAAYQKSGLDIQTDNLFDYANADAIHQAPGQMPDNVDFDALTHIMGRIVQELIDKTPVIHVLPDGTVQTLLPEARENTAPVTSQEINQFPEAVRPQLTGSLMKLGRGRRSVLALSGRNLRHVSKGQGRQDKDPSGFPAAAGSGYPGPGPGFIRNARAQSQLHEPLAPGNRPGNQAAGLSEAARDPDCPRPPAPAAAHPYRIRRADTDDQTYRRPAGRKRRSHWTTPGTTS